MENIIIEGLISFGYRPYPGTHNRVYAKPVGYNLYRFDLDTLVWVNQWQNGRTGELILVEGETAKLDLLDLRLQEYHASGRHESYEDFGFLEEK